MGSQMVQDTVKELQCTVAGGSKVCGGVNLSPRSTRGYLRTSLRCKQESLRMRELAMKVAGETNADQGQHCDGSSSSALIGELRRSSSIGAGAMHNQVEPILCEKRQRETPLLIADAVKKEGNSLIGDNSSKSSILKTAKISVNEIPNRRNVLSRSHSLRCPKQSLLRPIDVNCDYDIFNNSDSNMDTFKEQCMRKKDILQRKENRDYSKECKVEGSDVMAKKSSRFLRSWSFRLDNKTLPDNRKLNNNGTGFSLYMMLPS